MANHDLDDDILGRAYDARLMRRLWAFTRPHVRLVLATCALFPAVTLLELIQPYLVKIAIDEHILILRRDWAGLGWIAALFLLVLLVLYGLRAAQFYLTQMTGQRVVGDLRAALFAHLQRQDARFFDRNPVGRLMTRILNDGEAIQELFTSGLVSLVGDVLTLTGVVVIMLGMDWRLALVTFALVPVLALAAGYFRLRARDSYRIVRARLARLNAFLQETLQGMTVIQLFAREARERRTFEDLSGALRRGQFRSTFYDASLYATVEALGSAAVALLLWYGGGQVVTGALTFGQPHDPLQRFRVGFRTPSDLAGHHSVSAEQRDVKVVRRIAQQRQGGNRTARPGHQHGNRFPVPPRADGRHILADGEQRQHVHEVVIEQDCQLDPACRFLAALTGQKMQHVDRNDVGIGLLRHAVPVVQDMKALRTSPAVVRGHGAVQKNLVAANPELVRAHRITERLQRRAKRAGAGEVIDDGLARTADECAFNHRARLLKRNVHAQTTVTRLT